MNKKSIVCFIVCVISPIIIYFSLTLLLMLIRQDCFNAYEVYIGNEKYIYYNNDYYVEITDEEELSLLNKEINGAWFDDKEMVLKEPIEFPYFDYWIPSIMCNSLDYAEGKKYIAITDPLSGKDRFYKRVDEKI